jgi:N-glycosylase/DNA lyase
MQVVMRMAYVPYFSRVNLTTIRASCDVVKHLGKERAPTRNPLLLRLPNPSKLQTRVHCAIMGALEWHKIPSSLSELCINTTLRCGQSFRWRKNDAGVWSMALHNRILFLHQDPEYLYYRATFPSVSKPSTATPPLPTPPASHAPSVAGAEQSDLDDTPALVHHYLNLTPNLTSLYAQWSAADVNFAKKAPKFTGVRILRQDSWEALVGFICSSNNNIARISQMMHKLCLHYGPLIGTLDGEVYHDFPEPKDLAKDGVEANLRALGFGYRAKYIWKTACMVVEKEEGWLDGLRNPEVPLLGAPAGDSGEWKAQGRDGYRAAHEALITLQGVGPKVADCVCLMGLGWGEAVPVDTHVWQIAQRDYKFGRGKHSSLTKATYDAVGDKFRSLWGKEAGWAHSVLFTADLRAFSERLVAKVEVVEKKEIVEKKEEGDDDVKVKNEEVDEETVVAKVEKVTKKRIKRENEDVEKDVLAIEGTVRRSKRARN